jgi:hypothetical protein
MEVLDHPAGSPGWITHPTPVTIGGFRLGWHRAVGGQTLHHDAQ